MNKYQCLFTITTLEGKNYQFGDIITKEEYDKLVDTDKNYFMLEDLKYAI